MDQFNDLSVPESFVSCKVILLFMATTEIVSLFHCVLLARILKFGYFLYLPLNYCDINSLLIYVDAILIKNQSCTNVHVIPVNIV